MKDSFIDNEIWILTFGGAFQRIKIYSNSANEMERREFRNYLKREIRKLVEEQYHKKVSGKQHLTNIKTITKLSKKHKKHLSTCELSTGVSQKILNLYLKYLWCLGKIPAPPHCPIDSIILTKLKLNKKYNWSKINIKEYEDIIQCAKKVAGNIPLSEWELETFNRRASQ